MKQPVDCGDYDNNMKYECSTGKFGVASESQAILSDAIMDWLFTLSGNFIFVM